ncbi:MAG: exo-alpha-sialidase [Puniceicoccaceae bacterium]|nr:MAG: exo-alpha-sialidase [Puniceicoccaceae bacterium]
MPKASSTHQQRQSFRPALARRCLPALLLLFPFLIPTAAAVDFAWNDPIEVAKGEAHQGPWRMNDSDFRYVDDPSVFIEASGSLGVVWVDQEQQGVRFQRFDADGTHRFESPVDVSQTPGIFSWMPRLAFAEEEDGPGRVFVLWQEIVFSGGSHGGEIFFAASSDGGRSFQTPVNLSNTTAGAGKGRLTRRSWHNGSLDLALDPAGTLYAAWTEYEGRLWLARSSDGGASFSEPVHLAGNDAQPARSPSIAVGPDGALALAWTIGEDPQADIRVMTSADGGDSFSEPVRVASSRGHADAPKLALAPDGTLHLVYAEGDPRSPASYRILYTRSKDGPGAFEDARVVSRMAGAEGAHFPSLAADAEGRVFLAWEHFPANRGHRLGLGFTVSTDHGRSFAPADVIPGSDDPVFGANGGRQGLLVNRIAANATGDLAVAQSYFHRSEHSAIRLFHGRPVSNR